MNLGEGVEINLPVLLESRLLVQANSGGGKSYALRRLLEQTAGKVQQIVIDPEGEFSTLREKHDFIIAAPHDGDALAHPHTAKLLARRLLETGVSAIVDIYDLKAHERHTFVRLFLDAIVNAPKKLWHPALIVLDESHVFAPEKGKSEALGAVIDLATRGRKRGYCLVAATQRLAKLHKDVAAELLNKVIGRTGLDIDVKRVADELGLAPALARQTFRNLEPGMFHCFGPALSNEVVECKIGKVLTTHPKAGQRLMQAPPAPSSAIKHVLAELSDLPKEAEQEARSIEELKRENTKLKREATLIRKQLKENGVPENEVKKRMLQAVKKYKQQCKPTATPGSTKTTDALKKILAITETALNSTTQQINKSVSRTTPTESTGSGGQQSINTEVSSSQQKILNAVAYLTGLGIDTPCRVQTAAVAGFSSKSGSYSNNISKLKTLGLLEYPDKGNLELTTEGHEYAELNILEGEPSEVIQGQWLKLCSSPQKELLRFIIQNHPNEVSRQELADATGYSSSSGSFSNNISKLKTLGSITYPRQGFVRASGLLFSD